MDRFWLLTWSTYASRLPGDERGFVGRVEHAGDETRSRNNAVGSVPDAAMRGLETHARSTLLGEQIVLTTMHAEIIVDQLRETSDYRKQQLNAVAVMYDHIHVVVGVPGDPDPAELLRDYKSYASRALNARFGKPSSGTWWTASGSRRILKEDAALLSAIDYVRRQPNPLLLWCNES